MISRALNTVGMFGSMYWRLLEKKDVTSPSPEYLPREFRRNDQMSSGTSNCVCTIPVGMTPTSKKDTILKPSCRPMFPSVKRNETEVVQTISTE